MAEQLNLIDAASGQSSSAPPPASAPAAPSTSATTSATTTPNSPPSAAPAKPERPSWVSDAHWDAEKGIKPEFGEHYKQLATFKAAEDSRRLTLPQKPEDYPFELPNDFKPPQGVEFKLDQNDPLVAEARKFALESGLSKEQFQKMLTLHAGSEITRQQMLKTAVDGEIAKLGAAATARVTAVQNFLTAQLGEPMAKHMATMLVTAQHVEGFEKIMAAFRNQGAATFSNTGREPPKEPGRVDDAAWAKMTHAERLDYSRQFPQSQFWNGGPR